MLINKNTSDTKLKQIRTEASIKYWHSCDKLEILFSLLSELDNSHGLDSESVYAIAEVRSIAIGNKILDIDGNVPMRTLQILINHDTKNKNQACKDYYQQTKELLLTLLNQYDNTLGNRKETTLEAENKILKAKLEQLETKH